MPCASKAAWCRALDSDWITGWPIRTTRLGTLSHPSGGPGRAGRPKPDAIIGRPDRERSHRGLVRRFAKPLSGVTCFEGSNPSLSATRAPVAQWIERQVADLKAVSSSLAGRANNRNQMFTAFDPIAGGDAHRAAGSVATARCYDRLRELRDVHERR